MNCTRQKELLLGRDYEAVGSGVLDTFTIGARGENVNPKYAKLGWDRYWENDEWWVASAGSIAKNSK